MRTRGGRIGTRGISKWDRQNRWQRAWKVARELGEMERELREGEGKSENKGVPEGVGAGTANVRVRTSGPHCRASCESGIAV